MSDERNENYFNVQFVHLKKTLKTVEIDGDTFYVAEGDLLLDVNELKQYALQQTRQEELERLRPGIYKNVDLIPPLVPQLLGITKNEKIVRWAANKKLTYCVLKHTFWKKNKYYEEVVENMKAATKDWEDTCGVKFEYKPKKDESDNNYPEGVVFPVRGFRTSAFLASAFFPYHKKKRRRVLISRHYFTQKEFDHIGIMRHELGHVLGFRHEHIRSGAPPVCPSDTENKRYKTIDLTRYDPQSCMHYFCGGVGSRELTITELDKQGSRKIYGLPLDKVCFVK